MVLGLQKQAGWGGGSCSATSRPCSFGQIADTFLLVGYVSFQMERAWQNMCQVPGAGEILVRVMGKPPSSPDTWLEEDDAADNPTTLALEDHTGYHSQRVRQTVGDGLMPLSSTPYSHFFIMSIEKGTYLWASLVAQMVKNLPAIQETQVQSMGREDPLGKGMATHSSIPTWRISWTEEPGGLLSME